MASQALTEWLSPTCHACRNVTLEPSLVGAGVVTTLVRMQLVGDVFREASDKLNQRADLKKLHANLGS